MPQIADLLASGSGELGRSDALDPLDWRTRAQNQMAHGMLGAGGALLIGPLCGWIWAAVCICLAWAVAEGVQIVRGSRWSARQGWDSLADLGGWASGWLIAALLSPPLAWATAAAGLLALGSGAVIGAGYWLKYGSRNPA